jgi:transcription termination factor NusB
MLSYYFKKEFISNIIRIIIEEKNDFDSEFQTLVSEVFLKKINLYLQEILHIT